MYKPVDKPALYIMESEAYGATTMTDSALDCFPISRSRPEHLVVEMDGVREHTTGLPVELRELRSGPVIIRCYNE